MLTASQITHRPLAPWLQTAVYVTGVIDLFLGVAFLLGPELGLTLWPSAIAPLLMRFVGAIVIGNGVGALVAARQQTWEGLRALFTVALVYGGIVLVALLYHLLFQDADPIFWIYAAVDGLFLGPIIATYWGYENSASYGLQRKVTADH